MSKLKNALRRKYHTPKEALRALGLDEQLLIQEDKTMADVLCRKAAVTHGALLAYLSNKIAQDAKIDLAPIVAKVTPDHFSKDELAADLASCVEGKLAADVNLDDLPQLIDAIDALAVDEWPDKKDDKKKDDCDDDDDDDDKKKKKKAAEDAAALAKKNAMDKAAEDAAKAKDCEKEKAMDEQQLVSKPAMDAAIAAAVLAATKAATEQANVTQREIRDAERAVRPWVGDLAIACDSAEAVLRAALKTLGVAQADKIHESALETILTMQPKPGQDNHQRKASSSVAMDAAASKGYYEFFPGAANLKHL